MSSNRHDLFGAELLLGGSGEGAVDAHTLFLVKIEASVLAFRFAVLRVSGAWALIALVASEQTPKVGYVYIISGACRPSYMLGNVSRGEILFAIPRMKPFRPSCLL